MSQSQHQPESHAADQIRIEAAETDLKTAKLADLHNASNAERVFLVERLRGSLDTLLRICGDSGLEAARADLAEAEEADLGQATGPQLIELVERLCRSLDTALRACVDLR